MLLGEVCIVEDLADGHADVGAGGGLLGFDDPVLLGDVEVGFDEARAGGGLMRG